MKRLSVITLLIMCVFLATGILYYNYSVTLRNNISQDPPITSQIINVSPPDSIPAQYQLYNDYHIYQTFNNCGPASLSMALSYYDIHVSQDILGKALRPYQNSQGINDDKSVTLSELAVKSRDYSLIPYHRPGGTIPILKQFIAHDIPVITRTLLHPSDDIGHFRVIKGYDDKTEEIIQDDSMQGHDIRYSYQDFNAIWKAFGYEYLVLIPNDKAEIAKVMLGDSYDEQKAWKQAVTYYNDMLQQSPDDVSTVFNASVAYYHVGNYSKSIELFESVSTRLPEKALWYQIEPIQAYAKLSDKQKLFEITDSILNNQNRAFSELYLLRGDLLVKEGDMIAAKQEYEKAILYNTSLIEATKKLESL